MAVEAGVADVRQIDVDTLRAALTADGMELDPCKHRAFPPN